MLVLFLNELSISDKMIGRETAQNTALALLRILRSIKSLQGQVALNSHVPLSHMQVDSEHSLQALLGGNEFKDEWRRLRGFANYSPMESGIEAFNLQTQEIDYIWNNKPAIALGWANQLDTAVVSFAHDENWQTSDPQVVRRELDENAEIIETMVTIRNFSTADNLVCHATWLKQHGLEEQPPANKLWEKRETYFPNLRFLARTYADINNLALSGSAYQQALQRLRELDRDLYNWSLTKESWPQFSSRASPEGSTRKELCKVEDAGEELYFDWHLRFTGGLAGRIHFRISHAEQKAVIAYIGQKLDSPIVQ